MFSAFQQLSASPTDATVRQSALDAADVFAKRANDIGNTLASQKTDLYNKATELTQSANQTLQEVATLNQQIVNERLAGRDASTLIDQRNMKLKELSLVTDFSVIAGANDGISIQVGGTSLVDGATSSSLGVALDSAGKMAITVQGNSGTPSTADITSSISGGQLFAVQQARDVDLTQVSARFDQFVYDLATVINTQHAAGVGLDGQSGRDLFDISASSDGAARSITLSNDVAGKPEALAAAANSAELPGGSANAVLLNKLGSSSVISGNSKTPAQAYADIVGDVGNRRAASKADVALRQDILTQAQTARESTSGVSLDEEMVNLQKYERAYQAAGKVLTAADQLLQELLQRIGA
jgi:flagellar hook-associated protein 1 FlgK